MRVPLRPRDICALVMVGALAVSASGTHVVRSGESLHTIARKHGTTVGALVEANGIKNPNLILAGQQLSIPGSAGGGSSPSAGGQTHTVRSGETLATIASRYGTTVSALASANGISNPNLIRIGRSLHVQGTTAPAAAPPTTPASGSSGTQLSGQRHAVQPGETIAGIARRYGISTDDLIRWNGLVDGKLYATTRLVLFDPGSLPTFSGTTSTSGATHTVAPGQSLGSIASRHGVSVSAIASANGISDPNRIRAGQQLTIPGSTGTTGAGFACPISGARFFNDWAFPRSGGRAHAGTDLFAPRGTPVRAPVAGFVEVATGAIGGKQFRLTTAEGHLLFGSHLDSFGATGQVAAGTVIGTVGDTGNARGSSPHLHFEIHPGSSGAVNPFPLLRSVC